LRKDPWARMPAAEAAEALRRVAAGEPARAGRGKAVRRAEAARRAAPQVRPPSPGVTVPGTTRTPWSTLDRQPAMVGGGSRRGRSRAALLAGVPLLAVVVGLGGWYGYRQVAGSSAASPAPTGASSAAAPTASPVAPSSSPARPSPSGTSSSVPEGWRTHADKLGFTIALPRRWAAFGRGATRVHFRLPGGRGFLMVDTTRWTARDPLTALREVEAQAVAERRLPDYRLLSLRALTYRGRPAADWEFTWRTGSGRAHVIDRAFATADGRQFAIYWHTTDKYWKTDYPLFEAFAKNFRPS
ncbi:hypothetical protein, partial [Sphaerisporangium dianthi]